MLYEKDYHEFPHPYIDELGRKWFGFCGFEIEYRMKRDSIDYPNGLVRNIKTAEIEDFLIKHLAIQTEDASVIIEEEQISEEIINFFNEQFDPHQYYESLQ